MRLPIRPQPADRPQPAQEPRMSPFVPLGQHRAGPFPIPVSLFTILLRNSIYYFIAAGYEENETSNIVTVPVSLIFDHRFSVVVEK